MAGFNQQDNFLIIESVVPLDAGQIDTILLQTRLDPKQVRVINRRDSSLIAGIRLIYRGKVIDRSFKYLLDQLT